MRVVVLGGFGNFGARICNALADDGRIELVAAGRHPPRDVRLPRVGVMRLDVLAPSFAEDLAALRPELVIHCVGPFQGQGYDVFRAAAASGADYIDLADGRDFVAGFADANRSTALGAGCVAIAGASTLPALSTAVIDELLARLQSLDEIHLAIAPGQHAPRGRATLEAVLSYVGQSFRWLVKGVWREAWGWQELQRIEFDCGRRWAAACDVPDLELLPQRYPGVRTVQFRAALEVGIQHFALWSLAAVRRRGAPLRPAVMAGALGRVAAWLDPLGTDRGGMLVRLIGTGRDGQRRRLDWQLIAPANHGPEIPCMPAILLARRLAAGQRPDAGAYACMGMLSLADFSPEFSRWGISTDVREAPA
jgi:Saccharopine dehydrogenase NADP binding domain